MADTSLTSDGESVEAVSEHCERAIYSETLHEAFDIPTTRASVHAIEQLRLSCYVEMSFTYDDEPVSMLSRGQVILDHSCFYRWRKFFACQRRHPLRLFPPTCRIFSESEGIVYFMWEQDITKDVGILPSSGKSIHQCLHLVMMGSN